MSSARRLRTARLYSQKPVTGRGTFSNRRTEKRARTVPAIDATVSDQTSSDYLWTCVEHDRAHVTISTTGRRLRPGIPGLSALVRISPGASKRKSRDSDPIIDSENHVLPVLFSHFSCKIVGLMLDRGVPFCPALLYWARSGIIFSVNFHFITFYFLFFVDI